MTADRPTTQYSRRKFLGHVGQVSMALAIPAVIPGSALGLNGAIAPSNRIDARCDRHSWPRPRRPASTS